MDLQTELLQDFARFSADPVGFVFYAFPWGELEGELAGAQGPEDWQLDILGLIRDGLITPEQAILIAVASGHGVGKSALVSWIIIWALATFEDTRGVVTANTENQLKTKTWAELAKWFRVFIGREFFDMTATKICSRAVGHADTWRIDMVPWSENNTEAFAGLHNKGKRILVIFDEASAIPDPIFETTEGALTDAGTQIIWFMAGNPTKSSGRFREAFPGGARTHRWHSRSVDSRSVSITNKSQIQQWIDDNGEDSDFVRVRVRGMFPRTGSSEFISSAVVAEAASREVHVLAADPLVFGVDVARFGDDASVIYFRKGRDGRTLPPAVFRGIDTMELAGRISELAERYGPAAIFVDGGGVGGGVIDRLRQLRVPVIEVQFGARPDRLELEGDGARYGNKRSEIWGYMRQWLKGGAIPDDKALKAELVAPMYSFNANNAIMLEPKDVMRRRGVASPDIADALALTFAYPVAMDFNDHGPRPGPFVLPEWDPLEHI